METNKNLLIAMQVIKGECIKHSKCEDCPVWEHLDDICEPHYWRIPKETEEEQMNVKLKPCPFCGGRAHIEDISEPDDMGPIWMILCKKCGASASFGMDGCNATKVEAVDSWNRRAEMKRVIHAEV